MIKTQWFAWSEKPMHVGYYEVAFSQAATYVIKMYWDGFCWRENKDGYVSLFSAFMDGMWRGLAHKSTVATTHKTTCKPGIAVLQ